MRRRWRPTTSGPCPTSGDVSTPEPETKLEPDYRMEVHAYRAFEDMGFDVLECIALVRDGLSPSAVREFARLHDCDVRVAVSILL